MFHCNFATSARKNHSILFPLQNNTLQGGLIIPDHLLDKDPKKTVRQVESQPSASHQCPSLCTPTLLFELTHTWRVQGCQNGLVTIDANKGAISWKPSGTIRRCWRVTIFLHKRSGRFLVGGFSPTPLKNLSE